MKITYDLPRQKDPITLNVKRIIGIPPSEDGYLPMMWETTHINHPNDSWFDFKYMNCRNSWGLNKAAVFTKDEFHRLITIYETHTGQKFF